MFISIKDLIFLFIYYLLIIVGILISVAFLVVLERKILGYIQFRKGPNKVFFGGLFQPFSDAIKLFIKENIRLMKINTWFYYVSPMIGFFLSLIFLLGFPLSINMFSMNLYLFYMMSCMSLNIYVILLSSWSSNSNYSMLGGMRSISQSLSYEVVMFLIFFIMFFYVESYKLIDFFVYQENLGFFLINNFMFFILFIVMIAELNRMPFDFIEGESELVSGFNVEYMSGSFTLIFLAEYMMILNMGILFIYLFWGKFLLSIFSLMFVLIFSMMMILIRGSFPRLRYDNLMYFCWYNILSMVMMLLLLIFLMKFFLYLNL
uniref:NADH-ubiquinone oxidoreductase chain 1 n=1 Tax=Parapolybia crocea TaxID=2051043 RepID=A0A2D1WBF4_9HYME|nr:NADH dehydrogenase subunit 1 [Parapolybia crocea]ATP85025.1 NADH dehydrogenase subunit 1 [Parapolybia crocea]